MVIKMDTSIKSYIINNFKEDDKKEIESAIIGSIENNDEVALPGLGVFFELIWENSTNEEKNKLLEKIEKGIKKTGK